MAWTNLKYNNTAQTGRSMVEMLGVLAVMGVLSIGAVMGFNYGMNKHRANQVLSDIRLIYQETRIPSVMHNIVNNNSLPENLEIEQQSAYDYSFSFPDLDDFIYEAPKESEPNLLSVNVENVPQGVCDILLQNKPSYVLMLKVNGKSVWSCDANTNEMNYVFEASSDSLEVGTCSICTDSHCFDDDFNCPEGESCYNDTCSKCKAGYTENKSGNCKECPVPKKTLSNMTKEGCDRCGNTHSYDAYHGVCRSCEGINAWEMTAEECNRCQSQNPDVVTMRPSSEGIAGCFDCRNSFGSYPKAAREQCEKCAAIKNNGNVIFYPLDSKGTSNIGTCVDCSTTSSSKYPVLGQVNSDKTACVCPEGYFWTLIGGMFTACLPCDDSIKTGKDYVGTHKDECDKCPQRAYYGDGKNNNRWGHCGLCPEGQVKSADGRSCVESPTT